MVTAILKQTTVKLNKPYAKIDMVTAILKQTTAKIE